MFSPGEGTSWQSLRIEGAGAANCRPVELGIHGLPAFYHQAEPRGAEDFFTGDFRELAGTERFRDTLREDVRPVVRIVAEQESVRRYRQRRQRSLLH